MSGRPNPFQGLEELFERMSRQFENAARVWDTNAGGEGQFEMSLGGSTTGLDLADRGDEFVVTVDVPGYETEDLDVRLSGDRLHVSGEREHAVDESDETFIRRERRSQSFSRQVSLPEPVDPDGVSASVNNGVLSVTLEKREPSEAGRSIDIE
ncbi:Hsp20/alpha crystallin family protein [Salinilacihabitans rarus]|uniref:Hsp20/alpha crystallin family protein n=1 Tax=Salinilacihabitans rarus TaxID=2961596 RepID=UPI0020C8B249|nr:Hsp20/alpha crystallin family protein [Salinilacihabitans rarus]